MSDQKAMMWEIKFFFDLSLECKKLERQIFGFTRMEYKINHFQIIFECLQRKLIREMRKSYWKKEIIAKIVLNKIQNEEVNQNLIDTIFEYEWFP